MGRFITRDTVVGDYESSQTLNRYVYCVNNPHKYVDPDGKWSLKVGLSISLTLGAVVYGKADLYNGGYVLSGDGYGNREAATFTSESIGTGIGLNFGVDVSLNIEYNHYDTSVFDIEGVSVSHIGEVRGGPITIGQGPTNSIMDDGQIDMEHPGYEVDFGLGAGAGGGYSMVFQKTQIYPISSSEFEMRDRPWK